MFTIEQIKVAHSKVKSGADFPKYIRDLIQLGLESYSTYVIDGHTDYQGKDNLHISSDAKYTALQIADEGDIEQFRLDLKSHQQGNTDYPAFCSDCAKNGVEKWIVDTNAMTCTYFDKAGNNVLTEDIPSL